MKKSALPLVLAVASVCFAESALDLREIDRLTVSPRSGALVVSHDDLTVGHGPEAFVLRRTYARGRGRVLDFGSNWATCFGVRVVLREQGGYVRTPAGHFVELRAHDATTWVSTVGALWVDTSDTNQPTIYGLDGRAYVCDSSGWLQRIRRGHAEVHIERDGSGFVTGVRGAWGTMRCERVDGLLVALVLPSGERVSYTRGEGGVLASVDDASRRLAYRYDGAGRLDALAEGGATVRYDAVGRVVELGGPRLEIRSFAYSLTEGALCVEELQGARRVAHRFDLGGAWAEETVDGVTARRTFDERGNVRTFERGAQTVSIERDPRGRVTSRERNGRLTHTIYEGRTDAPSEQIRGGERLRFVRDASGRLTALVGPHGATRFVHAAGVRSSYDADGRLTERSLTGGGSERFERTATGLRVEARDAAGRLLRASEQDLRGRIVRIEGAHGQLQSLSYTPDGRLSSVDTPGAAPVQLSYDDNGRVTKLADASGTLASYSYPDTHTVIVHDASAGTTTLTRDSDGRVVRVARGDLELRRVYNEQGQLVAHHSPDGRTRYRYDAAGNLTQVRTPQGTTTSSYDAQGNRTEVTDVHGMTLASTYDASGRRTALRAPWGEVSYSRDEAGRLTAVTLPDGQRIRCELLADGRRSALHFPNGVSTRFSYEGALLTGQRTTRGDTVLQDRRSSYDAAGRLVEVSDLEGSTAFSYDAEGRLESLTRDGETTRYAYDARGNRTDLGAVDAGNRLLEAGGESLGYDAWGRLDTAAGKHFDYDAFGRLSGATLADGRELSWDFDHAGRRTSRVLDGVTTRFVHDGDQLAGTYDADTLRTAFVHGDRLDDTLAVLHDGEWHFPLADPVQSVVGLTNAQGELIGRASYAPFGATLSSDLPEWLQLGFVGRPFDRELGWVDMRARHYAPELARFTTPDPIGHRGGVNLYAYVSGNPLSFNDPRGTSDEDPTQAEIDAEIAREYRALLNEVPDWVAAEIQASGLDPLIALPVLAEHAESQGWISDETRGRIQTVVVSLAQAKLGTSIPTPINADDPDEVIFNAVVTLTILAATNGNPYFAAGSFAGGILLDYGLDYYQENYASYDLGPGHVTRRPDGTYTTSFIPGAIFDSLEELEAAFNAGYDPDGDGKFDYQGGRTPDLIEEGNRQSAFLITTVLPDGSFMSAHFPGVVFGPDESDVFLSALQRRQHLHSGPGYATYGDANGFHGDSLDRLLEYMQLNTVVNLATAQALGLEVFLVQDTSGWQGAANLSYSTAQFPTERYSSLQLLVEDATRAAQEEITWTGEERGVVGWNELPPGVMGPPAPIMGLVGGHYASPLLGNKTFDTLPEAFAAMDQLYALLEVAPAIPAVSTDASGNEVPSINATGQGPTGNTTWQWESPRVPGAFTTRAEVVRAYQAQPHIFED